MIVNMYMFEKYPFECRVCRKRYKKNFRDTEDKSVCKMCSGEYYREYDYHSAYEKEVV